MNVVVLIGAGSLGQAIARRVGAGKHIVVADLREPNADAAADVMRDAGFDVTTTTLDVSSRDSVHALVDTAAGLGDITGVIHAAGVSPSQAPVEAILAVDLYGTAVLLEEFGNVIAPGGAGVVIASQSGHRLGALSPDQNKALATTPADELLALDFLQPDQVADTLRAYQLAKRGNALRVMAEAVRWSKRGARVNTISPGIIITPLARDALTGPRGEGYRRMLEDSPIGRAGTPDELATVAALLMGPDGCVDDRQRLPDGRWRHRLLLLRRTRSRLIPAQFPLRRSDASTRRSAKSDVHLRVAPLGPPVINGFNGSQCNSLPFDAHNPRYVNRPASSPRSLSRAASCHAQPKCQRKRSRRVSAVAQRSVSPCAQRDDSALLGCRSWRRLLLGATGGPASRTVLSDELRELLL